MSVAVRKDSPTQNREIALLEAIADTLAQPGVRKRFLDAWRETAGWPASYRRANARLSQWLDPHNAHRFPVEALPTLIRACGHARMLDPLLALEGIVQRERRTNAFGPYDGEERIGPMRVRPETRRRESCA